MSLQSSTTTEAISVPNLDLDVDLLPGKGLVDGIISTNHTDAPPSKRIRFSKLFKPKPEHCPNIWKEVQKRRNKRKCLPVVTTTEKQSHEFQSSWRFEDGTPPPPDPDEVMEDFHKPWSEIPGLDSIAPVEKVSSESHLWRNGPAQYWYDGIGLPENPVGFDYGFQLKPPETTDDPPPPVEDYPPGIFDQVTHKEWEEDIIWDPSEVKLDKERSAAAGWIPAHGRAKAPELCWQCPPTHSTNNSSYWASSLPIENPELVYGRWEDDIIWDSTAMTEIPKPKVLTFDSNDENLVLVPIIDDLLPTKPPPPPVRTKGKPPNPHSQMSRLILGKVGAIHPECETTADVPLPVFQSKGGKDPYNISNDEYYQPKFVSRFSSASVILQHSVPALDFQPPFMPQRVIEDDLRNWHRPYLKRYTWGRLAHPGPHVIKPLTNHIRKMSKLWEMQRMATGGSEHGVLMRTPNDLTGRNGEIILIENCEEYPPLLSQTGMCSKIVNYYKRRASADKGPEQPPYGVVHLAHTSPFLGNMHQGQVISTLENNMYRAPIYQHTPGACDFLVIRTHNEYYIREIDAMFTAGQHCPLMEVPAPNSKKPIETAVLKAFIYRLFVSSKESPRSIKKVDVMAAFPMAGSTTICHLLKEFSELKRTVGLNGSWVLKSSVRLPSNDELRQKATPEQWCTYFSMLASQQRLKDAGYRAKVGKPVGVLVEPENDDYQEKLNDEEKAAPWNTTRAYLQAMSGKCLLQLAGPADPTGCGEGFSYVRGPKQPVRTFTDQPKSKKLVTGTDADLRRLGVTQARTILRSLGIPLKDLKNMGRWQLIDMVRTFHSEKNKEGEKGMTKFSRNGKPLLQYHEWYRKECQRIFDLQNNVLSSAEVLSTDEDDSDVEATDAEMEEMAKYLESLLTDKITSSQATHEMEEAQRMNLKKMMLVDNGGDGNTVSEPIIHKSKDRRTLRIVRTFKTKTGKESRRTEIVRDPTIIDTYLKIRSEPEPIIRQFAILTNETKDEMVKERRRLQCKIRVINKNLRKCDEKKNLQPGNSKMCGSCGQIGHMKTNKACPNYTEGSVTSDDMYLEEDQDEVVPNNLVQVEGTKVLLSTKHISLEEPPKRLPVVLKFSKGKPVHPGPSHLTQKRKRAAPPENDYLVVKRRAVRQRIDPAVVIGGIFETIVNNLRKMSEAGHFNEPVKTKDYPSYYIRVACPIDLHTIREKVRKYQYPTREEFLADIHLIRDNSILFNGLGSYITANAETLVKSCKIQIEQHAEELEKMEKMINPLLDNDTQKGLNFILESCIEKLKSMPESRPFIKPVPKSIPGYYDRIKSPMTLEAILGKIKSNAYTTAQEFMNDLYLISSNATQFNGVDHVIAHYGIVIVKEAREFMGLQNDNLMKLERNYASEESNLDPGPSPLVLNNTVQRQETQQEVIMETVDENGNTQKQPTPMQNPEEEFNWDSMLSPSRVVDTNSSELARETEAVLALCTLRKTATTFSPFHSSIVEHEGTKYENPPLHVPLGPGPVLHNRPNTRNTIYDDLALSSDSDNELNAEEGDMQNGGLVNGNH